jgi:hypothetical protein
VKLDPERQAMIRANAALAIAEFGKMSGMEFGCDEGSVRWVEGFIEDMREREERVDSLVSVIGCYLGEAIIAKAGGQWIEDDAGRLGVRFATGDTIYPFTKVQKLFDNGLKAGDSIVSFYNVSIDFIAKGKLREQAP